MVTNEIYTYEYDLISSFIKSKIFSNTPTTFWIIKKDIQELLGIKIDKECLLKRFKQSIK